MYYKLTNAFTRKQVGFQFQTNGYIDGYDIHGPNSRIHLTYDEFPNFVPDLRFELHPKSKLTDIVDASNISAQGFLINEKVKSIFEQCLLPEHRYYEASLLNHDGEILPYYWLHIISNDYGLIDFKASEFRISKNLFKDDLTKQCELVEVINIEDFCNKDHLFFKEDKYVIPDVLRLHDVEQHDLLFFRYIDINSVFISEKLANMLKKAKVTGIDITEYPDLQNLE